MLRDKFIHYFQQWRERQLSRGEHWLAQHLAGRSPREKGMLLVAAVFLFSAGYYVLIRQPLSERIEQQETMLQQLVAMNTRLKRAAPDIIAARKSATITPAQVSRVISDSASAHSVVIRRIAERGENIQVWIEPVVFNDLLKWLNALDEKYALRVTQIDVSVGEMPGMVNVQRLEFMLVKQH
ncbi:GspM family type II secretion system protein YghD [Escherichia coli]|uniref:GspM family type II secretion system protein YghD n=1 Tax=Escherichia coli TaxID=562 RepID=UPI000BE2C919|nr:GspM family type II secretion system protein YghD [Escherichia coli]HBQ4495430.1 GspM family type II secretion system protein YghD [Escherichia coli]